MAVTKVDTSEQFDTEFPRVRNWLIEALSHTAEFTEQDILVGLAKDELDLWVSPNAACIVQITDDDQPACLLVLVGGAKGFALREIMVEGQASIIAWAKAQGCNRIIGTPRKEWSRVLKNDGFKVDNKNNFYKDF